MFEHWGEFYLLAGSAAAVLIGLIFVVVTLMQDKSRSSMLYGSKLYMGPVVLQVSFVLVLSAAALTPDIGSRSFGLITAAVALWGVTRGVQSFLGIAGLTGEDAPHWSDKWCYGVLPTLIFLSLGLVAWGFLSDAAWAVHGVAVVTTAILVLAIRNEWDLVTWLAPRADG
jgi:hypothetical protein